MESALRDRIESLIQKNRVMLFMKGNKMFPQCGFSAHVVEILQRSGVPFETHNILSDPEVRQGLKEYSNWPTFPQLYIDGKLVGGADIVTELQASGELATLLGDKPSA
jgi:monothiol glutaredoxin